MLLDLNSRDTIKYLVDNNCYYLIEKIVKDLPDLEVNISNELHMAIKNNNTWLRLNNIYMKERYKECSTLFNILYEYKLPYVIYKGVPLSRYAYGQDYYRFSGDIDLLIDQSNMSLVQDFLRKQVLHKENFTKIK